MIINHPSPPTHSLMVTDRRDGVRDSNFGHRTICTFTRILDEKITSRFAEYDVFSYELRDVRYTVSFVRVRAVRLTIYFLLATTALIKPEQRISIHVLWQLLCPTPHSINGPELRSGPNNSPSAVCLLVYNI